MSSFDTLYLAGYELGMLYGIPFHVNWQKIILFNKTNVNLSSDYILMDR